MEAILIMTLIGLFVALAVTLGVDSRDGDDWITHRPA